jgi:hypothetical protein
MHSALPRASCVSPCVRMSLAGSHIRLRLHVGALRQQRTNHLHLALLRGSEERRPSLLPRKRPSPSAPPEEDTARGRHGHALSRLHVISYTAAPEPQRWTCRATRRPHSAATCIVLPCSGRRGQVMMRRICPVQTVPVLSHRLGPNSILLVLSACAHRRTYKHLFPTASTVPACALSQTNEKQRRARQRSEEKRDAHPKGSGTEVCV